MEFAVDIEIGFVEDSVLVVAVVEGRAPFFDLVDEEYVGYCVDATLWSRLILSLY